MSVWTYVASKIDLVFEAGFEINPEKVFGKQMTEYTTSAEWAKQFDHPDEYLPHGSEGTLHMKTEVKSVKRYPGRMRYIITIGGSLRDVYDDGKILAWFVGKLLGIKRQGGIVKCEVNFRSYCIDQRIIYKEGKFHG